jgi:5'(3')-deoxyribonucleotidase
MTERGIIAVDVDVTLVDTSVEYWKYLELDTKKGLRYDEVKGRYDFRPFYYRELMDRGLDGFEFWRQRDIYDHLSPRPHSIQVLDELSDDWDIVFASQLKGDHHKSKVKFLKSYFPFMSGFIGTKEKKYVRCNILIEDRLNHLNSMPSDVTGILFNSPHKQDEGTYMEERIFVANDWLEVKELINVIGNRR